MTDVAQVQVEDNPAERRYEVKVGDKVAGFAAYRLRGSDRIVFTHTEVDDAYAGQGLGGILAKAALEDVRDRGLGVVPLCPYIKAYIARHEEYASLVVT